MAMPMPNDGLKGLAPVEPQKLAGIMPNAQHQTFHGFMTGAMPCSSAACRRTAAQGGGQMQPQRPAGRHDGSCGLQARPPGVGAGRSPLGADRPSERPRCTSVGSSRALPERIRFFGRFVSSAAEMPRLAVKALRSLMPRYLTSCVVISVVL